jgi:hypothetical protein
MSAPLVFKQSGVLDDPELSLAFVVLLGSGLGCTLKALKLVNSLPRTAILPITTVHGEKDEFR